EGKEDKSNRLFEQSKEAAINYKRYFNTYILGLGSRHHNRYFNIRAHTPEEYNKEIKEDIKGTSYSHTLKIRAALSWGFTRNYRYGHQEYKDRGEGRYIVRTGEISSSIKAVSKDVIKRLYKSSSSLDDNDLINWGVYTLAFLYILRFNEVLRIEAYYIEVINLTRETGEIRLTLPFLVNSSLTRKTKVFLKLFRRYLVEIDLDPRLYRTYSFRYRGYQYFSSILG
ncbi:hypothetical protein F5882DRAFT_420405, partial [Hyaloscypha sp. PMI_1271]